MEESYNIKLPVYEGPLDLLLDLIRKQKINIYDIPIAKITSQYLSYLKVLKEFDTNLAGEFLFMAATLIYIKSRMLLPVDPLESEEETEDPRAELVQQLLEYEKFKNAAQMLHQKDLVERSSWTLAGIKDFRNVSVELELAVNSFDLIANFQKILERVESTRAMEIERDEITVDQVVGHLRGVVLNSGESISLTDLVAGLKSRRATIFVFVIILEMAYLQAISLFQKKIYGEIRAKKKKNFSDVMTKIHDWIGGLQLSTVGQKS